MSHLKTTHSGRPMYLDDMLDSERNSFGAVRLTAALAVLVSHCFFLATGSSDSEPLKAWTGYTLGQYGVQVFFVVSGILVTQSLTRSRGLLEFALARALRIAPALVVCVLLTALLLGPLVSDRSASSYFADVGVPGYLMKTLSLATGSAQLPGVFERNPAARLVNVSLWTLKYEVLCYLLLAAVGAVLVTFRPRPALVAVAVAIGACLILYKHPELGPANSLAHNLRYFILFFGAGALAFLARERIRITWLALPPLAILFVLAIGSRWAEVSSALLLGYAAIWLASLPMPAIRVFTAKNDLSYGVYIFGVPVTQTLLQLDPTLSITGLIAMTVAIVIPLAVFSWVLVERHAMRTRSRLLAALRLDRDQAELRSLA